MIASKHQSHLVEGAAAKKFPYIATTSTCSSPKIGFGDLVGYGAHLLYNVTAAECGNLCSEIEACTSFDLCENQDGCKDLGFGTCLLKSQVCTDRKFTAGVCETDDWCLYVKEGHYDPREDSPSSFNASLIDIVSSTLKTSDKSAFSKEQMGPLVAVNPRWGVPHNQHFNPEDTIIYTPEGWNRYLHDYEHFDYQPIEKAPVYVQTPAEHYFKFLETSSNCKRDVAIPPDHVLTSVSHGFCGNKCEAQPGCAAFDYCGDQQGCGDFQFSTCILRSQECVDEGFTVGRCETQWCTWVFEEFYNSKNSEKVPSAGNDTGNETTF